MPLEVLFCMDSESPGCFSEEFGVMKKASDESGAWEKRQFNIFVVAEGPSFQQRNLTRTPCEITFHQ